MLKTSPRWSFTTSHLSSGWGLGAFLRWWPPSVMWAGPLTHWGLTMLAEQRPGAVKAMQCSFPWRCWRYMYHAGYKWHLRALVLSPKLVILPKHLWFHDIWVLFVKTWTWMPSTNFDQEYTGLICHETRVASQIHARLCQHSSMFYVHISA